MKRVSKVLTALVLGTVLAGLAAGCGGGEKKADTIKVGANLEMTGGSASYGISSKNAIELAFKEINEKGGINGKQLELVVADNKSEAAEATNAMQKLVSQDNVVAVIGPNLSSSVIAASAINNSAKVLDIAPMATNPYVTVDQASGKTKDFNYRTCFIDPFQGTVMAKFATAELGVGNAAVLIDNSSDYAKGLAQFFKENFVKEGGAVTAEESYLQKDTDFKATLTKIKATNPDFLYVPGYYQEVGLIVKQARELGMNMPIAGGDGWDSAKMPEIAGAAALNNTYFSSLYSPEDSSDINKNFVAAYEKAYGQKPDVFAALSYDSALLVAEAIKNAGSTEPAKISEAMAKINGFSGVSGSVTFDDKHNPVKSAVILEYKDGAQSLKTKINP
ncbi:ABC transporter substrate-binding protein [Phascolarctobacterium sp. ET69]|jgi:branched-chain amino acid transport system substrate-binding protein|uniref:ABC transporter substrate-binding protein n=1 Tax=Phascolarctobacterium sp. ET69 TaxID=2939420 RepID=UPI000335B0E3|nr:MULTISPECIES: ABC transporter substrate-binding protein [Phascolarctobacterium]MCL1605385.1 ABC transporter substrate-binding protein [Phascolarctobacterium sp. ET69]MDM8110618.1 ABC transporter substrate-binding protein [Phascolarctobacterium faecium]CDB34829.1 ligand-binding protein receptor family [Phascolarctobacterium sp. CAG:266]